MDCAIYTVLVTYDEPSEAYIALVPEVPGCISQGETREEALQNVTHNLGACLEAMIDAPPARTTLLVWDTRLTPDEQPAAR